MSKIYWLVIIVLSLAAALAVYYYISRYTGLPTKIETAVDQISNQDSGQDSTQEYTYPIEHFTENQTKKVFAQYVTPETSPVQPENFTGYHTGVDIEVNLEDVNKGIPVYSIANGTIRSVRDDVAGYGGLIVIEYKIAGQTVTAIYGHIKYFSVEKKAGEIVSRGEQIAILGTKGFETDNERKHLHFGIHKGSSINILGYVQNKSELSDWIDPNSIYN